MDKITAKNGITYKVASHFHAMQGQVSYYITDCEVGEDVGQFDHYDEHSAGIELRLFVQKINKDY